MKAMMAAAMLFAWTISWNMTNVYGEVSTNAEAYVSSGAQDLDELRRKVDVMWTDYTNRMERARIVRERRESRRNSPPARPFRVKKGAKK